MGRIYWNVGIHKDHGPVSGCPGREFHHPGYLEHLPDVSMIVSLCKRLDGLEISGYLEIRILDGFR